MKSFAVELGELNEYSTGDGSFSLYSKYFGERFHNSASAFNEALNKFALPAELERFNNGKSLNILDVCFGLGYNSAVLFEYLLDSSSSLQWWGLEMDRRPIALALNQPSFCNLWSTAVLNRLEQINKEDGWSKKNSRGIQLWGDARMTIKTIPSTVKLDLIFHDAFSPMRCPQLWTEEFLFDLAYKLSPGGRLLTYSRSAAVRASLQRAGLKLFSITPAPGEKVRWSSGTMAVLPDEKINLDKARLRVLSLMEREHLNTRAAVPFRDPKGTDDKRTILNRRNIEQKQSKLGNTNAWHRKWEKAHAVISN